MRLDGPGPPGPGRAPGPEPDASRAGPSRPAASRAAGGPRDPTFAVLLAACQARLDARARGREGRAAPPELPAPVREAARLFRLGLSPRELARAMGVSVGEAQLLVGLARAAGLLR